MHFKLTVFCPAHTGVMSYASLGLLLPEAGGCGGDVKRWGIEPGLAVVIAQKLPDGFSELVNSRGSWDRNEVFAGLLKQQKVFPTHFPTSILQGPYGGPSWCLPASPCSTNRAGTFLCLYICWPWCLFTAMISTPAQICGEREGWKKAMWTWQSPTPIRAQTLLPALVIEILQQ